MRATFSQATSRLHRRSRRQRVLDDADVFTSLSSEYIRVEVGEVRVGIGVQRKELYAITLLRACTAERKGAEKK